MVGSFTAGDSARNAMSDNCRNPNPRSCGTSRSHPTDTVTAAPAAVAARPPVHREHRRSRHDEVPDPRNQPQHHTVPPRHPHQPRHVHVPQHPGPADVGDARGLGRRGGRVSSGSSPPGGCRVTTCTDSRVIWSTTGPTCISRSVELTYAMNSTRLSPTRARQHALHEGHRGDQLRVRLTLVRGQHQEREQEGRQEHRQGQLADPAPHEDPHHTGAELPAAICTATSEMLKTTPMKVIIAELIVVTIGLRVLGDRQQSLTARTSPALAQRRRRSRRPAPTPPPQEHRDQSPAVGANQNVSRRCSRSGDRARGAVSAAARP